MADLLKGSTGVATVSGATIYTVPADGAATIIGLRAVNVDSEDHWVTVEVGGTKRGPVELPLPVGSGYEFMEGGKIVANAGDTVVFYADADSVVEVSVDYLEQTPDPA